jgi:hypothetical protein
MTYLRTFSISTLLLLLVIFLLATNEERIREMVALKGATPSSLQNGMLPIKKKPKVISFPDVIKLPGLGDFSVEQMSPPKRKPAKKVKRQKTTKVAEKSVLPKPKRQPPQLKKTETVSRKTPQQPTPASTTENKTEDTRPQFQLDYQNIGLEKYLAVAEKIGRLYTLKNDGDRPLLGRQISFRDRRLSKSEDDSAWRKEYLAVERPYLVKDDKLRPYLKVFSLSDTAYRDQLVFYLNKAFDEDLWDKVEMVLKKKKYKLSDIKSVKGQYLRYGRVMMITITDAVTKSGEDIYIEVALALPCGSCL